MGRFAWLMVIGTVVLAALAWFGIEQSIDDDDAQLGPPVVVPSETSTPDADSGTGPGTDADSSADTVERCVPDSAGPTLEPSSEPDSPASDRPAGADRITPAPPRTAGDDDDFDDDDDDDSDDLDNDDEDDDDD